MRREAIGVGKTVEEAIKAALAELNASPDKVTHEILELPKKGFLGLGEAPAKVKVIYEMDSSDRGLDFIKQLIGNMGIRADAEFGETSEKNASRIYISGEDAGILIGHHGETLDSLQYLTNLVVNKRDEEEGKGSYNRVTVDIENYREKREATLRTLAKNMAAKAVKLGRNVTLEPMSSYERRIIHSEIQEISGVTTYSIGENNNRKIVISPENKPRTRRPVKE